MTDKPELIVISQNLLGGGASFHRNMLNNKPTNNFDIKTIYLHPIDDSFSENTEIILEKNDLVFKFIQKNIYQTALNLSKQISNKEGVIITNLYQELFSLDLFPKNNKTIYFICHDDGFLPLVKKYEKIIDIFITHNSAVFNEIKKIIPNRTSEIFFIPHGVKVQDIKKEKNQNKKLRIVFLARHHVLKGIYDLPLIDEILRLKQIDVIWTILGDGPENTKIIEKTKQLKNFNFEYLKNNDEILKTLQKQDVFILPSRKDGLPVSLLEAMSVGVVPIISKFSEGIVDVVTDDIGSVVHVGDNEAFAEEIENLHNDRNLLFQKSENVIRLVKDKYNIKERAEQYFDLYKNFKVHKRSTRNINVLRIIKIIYYKYYINIKSKIKELIKN